MPFYYSQSVLKVFRDYERQLIALKDYVALPDFREKTNAEYQAKILNHLEENIKKLKTITTQTLENALTTLINVQSAYIFSMALYHLYSMESPPVDRQYHESSRLMFKWHQINKHLLLQRPDEVLALDPKEIKEQQVTLEDLTQKAGFLLEQKTIGGKSYPDGLPLSCKEEILLHSAILYVQAEIKKNPRLNQKALLQHLAVTLSTHLGEEDNSKKETLKKMMNELFSYVSLAKYTLDNITYIPKMEKENIFQWIKKISHGFDTIKVLPSKMISEDNKSINESEDDISKIIPENSIYLREEFMSVFAYWKEDYYDSKLKKWLKQFKKRDLSKIALMDLELPSINQITDNISLIDIIKMRYVISDEGPYFLSSYNILIYILNDKSYVPKLNELQNKIDRLDLNLDCIIIQIAAFYAGLDEKEDIDVISNEYKKALDLSDKLENLLKIPELKNNHDYIIKKLIELGITNALEHEFYTRNLFYLKKDNFDPLPLDLFSQYKKYIEILKVLMVRAKKILHSAENPILSDNKIEAKALMGSLQSTPAATTELKLVSIQSSNIIHHKSEEKTMQSRYSIFKNMGGSAVHYVGEGVRNAVNKLSSYVVERFVSIGSDILMPFDSADESHELKEQQKLKEQKELEKQELEKQVKIKKFNAGVIALEDRVKELQKELKTASHLSDEMDNIVVCDFPRYSKGDLNNVLALQKHKETVLAYENKSSLRRREIITEVEKIEDDICKAIEQIQKDYENLIAETKPASNVLVGQSQETIKTIYTHYEGSKIKKLDQIQADCDKLNIQNQEIKSFTNSLDQKYVVHLPTHSKVDEIKENSKLIQGIEDKNIFRLINSIKSTLDDTLFYYTSVKRSHVVLKQANALIDCSITALKLKFAQESIRQEIDIYYHSKSRFNLSGRDRADELKKDISNCRNMNELQNHMVQFIKTGKTASDEKFHRFFVSPTRRSSIAPDSLQGKMIDFFFNDLKSQPHDLRVVSIKNMLNNEVNIERGFSKKYR